MFLLGVTLGSLTLYMIVFLSITDHAGSKIFNTLQLPNICISSVRPHRGTTMIPENRAVRKKLVGDGGSALPLTQSLQGV